MLLLYKSYNYINKQKLFLKLSRGSRVEGVEGFFEIPLLDVANKLNRCNYLIDTGAESETDELSASVLPLTTCERAAVVHFISTAPRGRTYHSAPHVCQRPRSSLFAARPVARRI